MNNKTETKIKQTVLPVIAAFIWGVAFVAQDVSTEYIGPFTFNALRSVIGVVFLGLMLVFIRCFSKNKAEKTDEERKFYIKKLLIGGFISGTMLTVATNLQQMGIGESNAGKAAFITSLYLIIVPILGLLFKQKISKKIFISLAVALLGLYLISVKDGFTVETGDILLLGCAFCFAAQIIAVDRYGNYVNGVELSFVQFATVAAMSGILSLIFDVQPTAEQLKICALPLLYVGVMSTGVAYTLQIIAQKNANPTVVTLLLSLESVFGALSSAIILPETRLSLREYVGCALVFCAVIFSQLPPLRKKEKTRQIKEE